MLKALMFDLDGTLTNTLYSIAYFGNTALSNCGYSPCDVESYRQKVGNGRDKLVERMVEDSLGRLDSAVYEKVGAEYDRLYAEQPSYLVEPYEGILDLLKYIKDKGLSASIISNKPDDMTKAVVSEVLGYDYFTIIEGAKKDVPKKPDPTAPLSILMRMNIKPDECIYVGDSGVDMITGKNAGMKTIGCSWGFRGKEELAENGADYLVDSAFEIIDIIKNNI